MFFEIADITKAEFEDESFDVIYSRDTLLHIGDKEGLFVNFFVSGVFLFPFSTGPRPPSLGS